jgi:hypothetical protein
MQETPSAMEETLPSMQETPSAMEEMQKEESKEIQEYQEEKEYKNKYSLLTQNFSESESDEILTKNYELPEEELIKKVKKELIKTNNKNTRESLKLKIKMLENIVEEEEKKIKKNPLSKKNKLIDTQGNLIENANYDTNDTCFNRVPIETDKTNQICKINEDEYIKKTDLEYKYMPIDIVNKDYVKKDNIPCWGCNLK